MSELRVSAGLVVVDGHSADQVKRALFQLQQATAEEQGCIVFEVLQHNNEPNKFTLWERWVDQGALDAHFEASHTLDYLKHGYTDVVYIEKLHTIGAVE